MKRTVIFFTWAVILFGALVLIFSVAGCRVARRSAVVQQSCMVTDSTGADSVQASVHAADSFYESHSEVDTAVGISGEEVIAWLPYEADTNLDTTIRKGNVSLHVYHDRAGRQHLDCKADSFTIVIARLVKDSIRQGQVNDSISVTNSRLMVGKNISAFSSSVTVTGSSRWRRLTGWLIAALLGIVCWETGKRLIFPKYTRVV